MKRKIIPLLITGILLVSSLTMAKDKSAEEEPSSISPEELQNIKTAVENHGTSLATLTNQVNEIVTKLQEVSGETGKNLQNIREQGRVVADAETRLQVLEDQITILTGQLQELVTEGLLSKPSTKLFDEYKDYARGLEHINAKNYEQAIKEFNRFKNENKNSIYNSYAQYWIGESHFMQSDYAMAIKQFQEMLNKNPKSAKAPTALYRQGLSFYHLNSFDEANAFFAKVIRAYPESIESIQASSQIKRINTILDLKKQQEWEQKMIQ